MKHLLNTTLLLATLANPAFAATQDDSAVYEPQSSIIPGGGGFGPGMIVGYVSADEKAFNDLVNTIENDPAFASYEMVVGVGEQRATVNRKSEKAPTSSSMKDSVDALVKVLGRNAGAKGNLHVEWREAVLDKDGKVQVDGNGNQVNNTLSIDAGASWGAAAAAEAEASMRETMDKNHK